MARDTSIESLKRIKECGFYIESEIEVYACLYEHGGKYGDGQGLTQTEAWTLIGKGSKDYYGPRFAVLERNGLIKDLGVRTCHIRGTHVHSYDVTSAMPKEKIKDEATEFVEKMALTDEQRKAEAKDRRSRERRLEAEIKLKDAEIQRLGRELAKAKEGVVITPVVLPPVPGEWERRYEVYAERNGGITGKTLKSVSLPGIVEMYCDIFKVPRPSVKFRELAVVPEAQVVKRELADPTDRESVSLGGASPPLGTISPPKPQ